MVASDLKDILLIQGDSLTLPRNSVAYIDTWPGLLQRNLVQFHTVNIAQSEKTTADFSGDLEAHHKRELEYYEPQTIVVQVGIVDCAPRYFRKWEKELLDLVPVDSISSGVFFLVKHLRSRSEKRAYIDQSTFKSNLESYCHRAQKAAVDRVVLVKILQAGKKYSTKNPRVERSITQYNSIIDDVAKQFSSVETLRPLADDPATEKELIEDCTLLDGYHLNKNGHQRLFERLPIS